MGNNVSDFVAENSFTVGPGVITLAGALPSYARLSGSIPVGPCWYAIADENGNREAGEGNFNGSTSLTRVKPHTTIVTSVLNKNNPPPISLSGSSVVSIVFTAGAYESIIADMEQLQLDVIAGSEATQEHINKTVDAHTASSIISTPSGNLSAIEVQGALNELQDNIDSSDVNLLGHINDDTDAHDASSVSVIPSGNLAADDVQEALEELQAGLDSTDSSLADHVARPVDAHDASAVSFDNTISELLAEDVQSAIEEVVDNYDILDTDVSFREVSITALEHGGGLTQNGATVITIAAGGGEIIDSYSDTEVQSTKEVDWIETQFDLAANGGMPVATGFGFTDIAMNKLTEGNGTASPVAIPSGLSDSQRRTMIRLGWVEYQDQVITKVVASPIISNQIGNTLLDFIAFIDSDSKMNGLILRPTEVGNITVWRDSGQLFSIGSNYENDLSNQNVREIPSSGAIDTPVPFYPTTYSAGITGVGVLTTLIPNASYEPDPVGGGGLETISNGKAVIHYMLESLGGTMVLSHGQQEYADYGTAKANLFADRFSHLFPAEFDTFVLLAQIVILKNTSVWGPAAEIFPLGSAVSSGSSGGSATSALNVGYADTYSLGTNVQVAIDSLAALKLTADQNEAIDSANAPSATNPIATIDDIPTTASEIANVPSGTIASIEVQSALNELDSNVQSVTSGLGDHTADIIDAHDSSAISYTPSGSLSAVEVQGAIDEVEVNAGDLDTRVGLLETGSLSSVEDDPAPILGGDMASNEFAFMGSSYRQVVDAAPADASTHAIDFALGDMQQVICPAAGTLTFAFADFVVGQVCTFILDLINGGNCTITYPAGVHFAGKAVPTYTAAGTDQIVIVKDKDEVYTWTVSALDKGAI